MLAVPWCATAAAPLLLLLVLRLLIPQYIDMLQVGSSKLTDDEARTHFAAWCVTSAPLILGYDLTDTAAAARAMPIVGNAAAITINQVKTADQLPVNQCRRL